MKRLIGTSCRHVAVAVATLALLGPVSQNTWARVYAYPLKDQSAEQQQKDNEACNKWATQQTGFDPQHPPAFHPAYAGAPPPAQQGFFGRGSYGEGGGILDAGKGAGAGALFGAIAGNAGAGAAIGALSGIFLGGVRRSNEEAERQQWYAQQQQQESAAHAQYQQHVGQMQAQHDRAYSACMSGRGYRVD